MEKRYFIFRNATVENLFAKLQADYSGYSDISYVEPNVNAYIWAYLVPFKTNTTLLIQEVEAYLQHLQLVLTQIPAHKTIYVLDLYVLHHCFTENNDQSVRTTIEHYNHSLAELSASYPNLKVLNFSSFCGRYAQASLVDWRFYYLSQMPLNPKLASDFHHWLEKEMDAIEGKRKKCIVLDLDNTLWGGILGEDGVEGIQVGNSYPGNAFLDFQQNLLELSKRGVILTVCSKNNESDVMEAWEQNPFLAIKKEQLAAWRINWNSKADNIKELAKELNIGLDSMVFVDDNPSERELVKQLLPTVEAPEFPKQPYLLPDFFAQLCNDYFQVYQLTDEDRGKLEQYKANAERTQLQQSLTSFDDYLRSLDIVLDIQQLNAINLPRIAQLTQKTNQFNLTTKRYTDADILRLQAQGAAIFCVSVSDRFGDSGITGAAIVTFDKKQKTATIDNFLLSCRILGKGIENVFLRHVLKQVKERGYTLIVANYLPTAKNGQVSNFYDSNGFELHSTDSTGSKHYECRLTDDLLEISDLYTIKTQ